MNVISARVRRSPVQVPRLFPLAHMPVYVRLPLLITLIVGVLTAAIVSLSSLDTSSPNPIFAYAESFPGKQRNTFIGQEFGCGTNPDSDGSEYCTSGPPDGAFSYISINLKDGSVSRINFEMRSKALTVGDLPASWGRPKIRIYGQSVLLDWPEIGVSANAWAKNEQFSYFNTVVRISIGPAWFRGA